MILGCCPLISRLSYKSRRSEGKASEAKVEHSAPEAQHKTSKQFNK